LRLLRRLLLAGDRPGWALAGAGIGMRALPADREPLAVAQAAIAAKVHQALDVHCNFAPEVTLNGVVAIDRLANLRNLEIGELIDPGRCRDAHPLADFLRELGTNSMDVLQADDDALLRRDIHTSDTGHVVLLATPRSGRSRLIFCAAARATWNCRI